MDVSFFQPAFTRTVWPAFWWSASRVAWRSCIHVHHNSNWKGVRATPMCGAFTVRLHSCSDPFPSLLFLWKLYMDFASKRKHYWFLTVICQIAYDVQRTTPMSGTAQMKPNWTCPQWTDKLLVAFCSFHTSYLNLQLALNHFLSVAESHLSLAERIGSCSCRSISARKIT